MRGSSTLCSAVARGSRLKVWNTNPISLLRMRASASSSSSDTCWLLSQYSPEVGVSRQPIRFMSVDLPDPDGPITATYSLYLICRLTPCRARTTSPPMSYSRVSLCVRMMISGSGVSPVRNGCSAGIVIDQPSWPNQPTASRRDRGPRRLGPGAPPPPPGGGRVLPHRQRDDGNRQRLLARVRDDARRGGKIRSDVGRRLVESDLDLVVHGSVVLACRGLRRVAHAR